MKRKQRNRQLGSREISLLWELMILGNSEAFKVIIEVHYRDLLMYGLKLCGNRDTVRDAIQEIFCNIWETRERISKVQNVKMYLLISIRREILRRRQASEKLIALDPDSPSQQKSLSVYYHSKREVEEDAKIQKGKLHKSIEGLTQRQKEVIHLAFFQNLKPGEIATILNLKPQSVYNTLHTSIKEIRRLFFSE
jgi:RNA polymerase sigma factor (sigma-70 family)